MAYEEDFFNEIYFLDLKNRLNFFLLIWNKGKFQNDLEQELELTQKESLKKYAEMMQKLGFLSIEKR